MSMLRSLKSAAFGLIAAFGLAFAAPSVDAATLTRTLVHEGQYTVTTPTQFSGTMDLQLAGAPGELTGPGGIWAEFTVVPAGTGFGELALTNYHSGLFTGLTAKWVDVATNTTLATLTPLTAGLNTLATVFTAATQTQRLELTWDSLLVPQEASQSSLVPAVYIAPVPLPASGLLLVGALGGIAALRRKKKELA